MSYATVDEFKQRLRDSHLVQLSADSGTEADEDMLQAILTEVDGLIDTAANTAGYATPIVSTVAATKAALRSHELSIAKFLLLDRGGMGAYDPAAETLYKAANSFLDALGKGDLELAGAGLKSVPTSPTGAVHATSEDRFFGKGSEESDPMRGI